MASSPAQIAIVGDLHSAWDQEDVTYFARSSYRLVLFTGDLGASASKDGRRIAKAIMGLNRRALIMPGNNDVPPYAELRAELTFRSGMAGLLRSLRYQGVDEASEPVVAMCGYSAHESHLGVLPITIIACRPFAMGGSELSFPDLLAENFAVTTMEESVARLEALVDSAEHEALVFLAHNGPTGLGIEPASPWGSDFHAEPRDWGDSDLRAAIDYARVRGRRPLAVIAGHMHWAPTRTERRWRVEQDGILYINAARVPRITYTNASATRHHICLGMTKDQVWAEEIPVTT